MKSEPAILGVAQLQTMPFAACHQMHDILNEVAHERERQYIKWGYQYHGPAQFVAILGEEVGEVNKEVVERHFLNWNPEEPTGLRQELIQVAAVAVQFVQMLDDRVNDYREQQQQALARAVQLISDASATTKHNPLTSDQPGKDNG